MSLHHKYSLVTGNKIKSAYTGWDFRCGFLWKSSLVIEVHVEIYDIANLNYFYISDQRNIQ